MMSICIERSRDDLRQSRCPLARPRTRNEERDPRKIWIALISLLAALGVSCDSAPAAQPGLDLPKPLAHALTDPEANAVRRVVARRCMICHACYDAPCQLVLSSRDGLLRGASKDPVYHSSRLLAAPPTRL